MNLIRRLVIIGALLFPASRMAAQIVERPVPFDSAGLVTVMTPFLAEKAALRPPWWPVSGDFTDARLFTANDSTYVLAVTRRTGVVERYALSATDRDAIRAVVSRLPRAVIVARNDARNAFIKSQTILGIFAYGPTFAGAISNNSSGLRRDISSSRAEPFSPHRRSRAETPSPARRATSLSTWATTERSRVGGRCTCLAQAIARSPRAHSLGD